MRSTSYSLSICVVAGALVPMVGFTMLGLIVGSPLPVPSWLIHQPMALFALVWLVPVLACAFVVARVAKSKAAPCGILAGLTSAIALVFTALTSEYSQGDSVVDMFSYLWPALALSLGLLPMASFLWARDVA
jgi:hypothetical protein